AAGDQAGETEGLLRLAVGRLPRLVHQEEGRGLVHGRERRLAREHARPRVPLRRGGLGRRGGALRVGRAEFRNDGRAAPEHGDAVPEGRAAAQRGGECQQDDESDATHGFGLGGGEVTVARAAAPYSATPYVDLARIPSSSRRPHHGPPCVRRPALPYTWEEGAPVRIPRVRVTGTEARFGRFTANASLSVTVFENPGAVRPPCPKPR